MKTTATKTKYLRIYPAASGLTKDAGLSVFWASDDEAALASAEEVAGALSRL